MSTEKTIWGLKIGEEVAFNELGYTRVPGGWMVSREWSVEFSPGCYDTMSEAVFVPYCEEGKDEH